MGPNFLIREWKGGNPRGADNESLGDSWERGTQVNSPRKWSVNCWAPPELPCVDRLLSSIPKTFGTQLTERQLPTSQTGHWEDHMSRSRPHHKGSENKSDSRTNVHRRWDIGNWGWTWSWLSSTQEYQHSPQDVTKTQSLLTRYSKSLGYDPKQEGTWSIRKFLPHEGKDNLQKPTRRCRL